MSHNGSDHGKRTVNKKIFIKCVLILVRVCYNTEDRVVRMI